MPVGLIRVVTLQDEAGINNHGRLLEVCFPGLRVESRCIEDQPEGVFDERTFAMAVPKIVRLGKQMASEGMKAVIVSCADDPGVPELRKILDIPVIGAGSASASLALSLANRIGTLGIVGNTPRTMRAILGPHLVAETKPKKVTTTLDLLSAEGRKNALEAAEYLHRSGAEIIALACTGFSTIRIARELENKTGLPVIDAVEAAGLFARHFTAHSRSVAAPPGE